MTSDSSIILRQSIQQKCRYFHFLISNDHKVTKSKEYESTRYLYKIYKRWLCQNDLFFLACLTGQEKIVNWWKFYRPFCDKASLQAWKVVQLGIHEPSIASNDDDKDFQMLNIGQVTRNPKKDLQMQRMFLKYRTFYKTTIVTKLKSVHLLLNFPNIHFVLCHNKEKNSSDNLMAVKNMFLSQPILNKNITTILKDHYGIEYPSSIKELFPECIPDGKEWGNMTSFSLKNRTDWSRSEDNIEAVGVDTEITGRHWQLAIKNDLVTEKSVNTEDQIKKTMSWDERFNTGNFDDPQFPLQDYEGTRYHFADLYSVKKNDMDIKLEQTPILRDLEKFKQGDNSQIVHPERFDREGIKKMMSKDMWIFSCQMLLKPEDPAKMQFRTEMIRYYKSIPKGCNYYLVVDPASVAKKRSDYTVMKVIAVIKNSREQTRRYVVDGLRDKINTKQRVDKAIELAEKWKVKDIAWESIAFQETDTYYFEERRRLTGLRVSPTLIKYHDTKKEDRIRGLVPEYASGGWLWPEKGNLVRTSIHDGKSYDLTVDMEYEFLQFPLASHDDLLDAQTLLNRLNITIPFQPKREEPDEGMTFKEYHKIIEETRNEDKWAIPRTSYV